MSYVTDYSAWPYSREIHSRRSNTGALLADGIHSIVLSQDGMTLDLLSLGFSNPETRKDVFIVAFNGAVSTKIRAEASAPFFSGVGLSKSSGIPLLAVSDPSLAMSKSLTLGWYAGNEKAPKLLDEIADLIIKIANSTGRKVILVGGSGGAFAAIQVVSRLSIDATANAWNSQTAIGSYFPSSVAPYIETAFPQINIPATAFEDAKIVQKILDENIAPSSHRLCDPTKLKPNQKVIYLQNKSDATHALKHAGPWLNKDKFVAVNEKAFINSRGNIVFFPGEWGRGHISPPLSAIIELITEVADNHSLSFIAAGGLTRSSLSEKNCMPWLAVKDWKQTSVTLNAKQENNLIHLTVTPAPSIGNVSDFDYAFNLYDGQKRIAQRWYKNSNVAVFADVPKSSDLSLHAYLRDRLGTIKRAVKKVH